MHIEPDVRKVTKLPNDPKKLQARFSKASPLWICCCGLPMGVLMFALVLGMITYWVASAMFYVVSLTEGARWSQTNCESEMTIWFIVFGSFGVIALALSCRDRSQAKAQEGKAEASKPQSVGCGGLVKLMHLFMFCWLCYGLNLTLNKSAEFSRCNSAEWYWFYLIVRFMFYTFIALACGAVAIMCCMPCMLPVLLDEADLEAGKEQAPSKPVEVASAIPVAQVAQTKPENALQLA